MLNGVWEQFMSSFFLDESVPLRSYSIRLLTVTVSTGNEKYSLWGMRVCFQEKCMKEKAQL